MGTFGGRCRNSDHNGVILRVMRLLLTCDNCNVCFEKKYSNLESSVSSVVSYTFDFPCDNSYKYSYSVKTWRGGGGWWWW